jgi:3-oxoadipate enol-lactonase
MSGERVEVRGATLAVERQGAGRPLLWCHGLTSSRSHEDTSGLFGWDRPVEGFEVVRYDARGHGESSATRDPDDYRWDRLALDLVALADSLGFDRFVAGGASMGAATVLHAAVQAPDRLDALVVVIPPTAWETRAAQAGMYEAGVGIIEERGLDAFRDLAAGAPVPAIFEGRPDLAHFTPQLVPGAEPTVFRGAARSDLPPPDALRTVRQPTLILAWATDPGHPVSTADALVELLPHAHLLVAADLADVATWPDEIRHFLRTTASAGGGV